jgi:hypothetical protein
MTVEDKLSVHLEHIVMPEGVPLNAKQVLDLCDHATEEQRMKAFTWGLKHGPLILPDEVSAALRWVKQT